MYGGQSLSRRQLVIGGEAGVTWASSQQSWAWGVAGGGVSIGLEVGNIRLKKRITIMVKIIGTTNI